MPFLSKDQFQEFTEWANDDTGDVWQRMNATGAFCGLCYAAGDIWRNLRVLRGTSSMKYRIITDFTDAENRHIHIEVAEADSEEEFLDLLKRLNSLTVQEVLGAASSDRMEMLQRLIERARNIDVAVANEHQEFLSIETLQKISRLERAETSLQQKLEEAQKALRNKEAENQELQDEFCTAMAQQALEQVSDRIKGEAEPPNATASTENGPDSLGQSSEANSTSDDASSSEARHEGEAVTFPDIEAEALSVNSCSAEDTIPFLLPQSEGSTCDEIDTQTAHLRQSEMSFAQRVLHGPFRSSLARAFWQLARAPYRSISCNHVELEGKVWEVIAHNRATETLVIGRRVEKTDILEVGFRGTVTADVYGNRSAANWSLNLDAAAVPLQAGDRHDLEVPVHKGFQDAYLAVNSTVVQWLEKSGTGCPAVRIAGHSLGGALATLFAVDIKRRGWQIDGVVTFGSPRVGQGAFKSLYQELNLHHLMMRFANQTDPVPWVPPSSSGFEHVVEEYALGSTGLPTGSSHSMAGSPKSYCLTLQDALEGHERDVQYGIASRVVTYLAASKPTWSDMAMQVKEELKVDLALLRQDITKLAEGMIASVEALRNNVRQIQQWEWLLDMQTLTEIVRHYKSQLQTWQQGLPGWFIKYKIQVNRIHQAAKMELRDLNSQLAHQFVVLYLRAAPLLVAAMSNSGAQLRDVDKEAEDFVAAAKELVLKCLHFDIRMLNEILQLLPSKEDFAFPEDVDVKLVGPISNDRIVKLQRASLQVGCRFIELLKWSGEKAVKLKCDSEEPMNAPWWQLTSNTPHSQTSMTLEFKGCEHQPNVSVQQLAINMPQNLTSLILDFSECKQITDASVQQLAINMPQNLTSLILGFSECEQITDTSVQQLASKMPQNLTSLSLDFSRCMQITDASVQQLASKMPQNLTSLSLDFNGCRQVTDASVQQLASKMSHNLTSLSLGFSRGMQITDASVQQLASKMPQNLTSLRLDFSECKQITDASVQQLASKMPQNLTSLSFDFSGCFQITGAGFQ
eukprot:s1854_g10.t1